MKRIAIVLISLIIMLGFTGCDKKPPKRAYYHQEGAYGMRYHISIYFATNASGSHSPSFKLPKYEYSTMHIYTDDLGSMKGDKIIMIDGINEPLPYAETGQQKEDINLILSKKQIVIRGFSHDQKFRNGTYRVETTSPDSWETPIVDWG